MSHDPDEWRFRQYAEGNTKYPYDGDSPVDLSGREGAPKEPELTEEVCALARYELAERGLLNDRHTNAAEDEIIHELAADIQAFVDNWIAKRIEVEK